MGQFKAKFSRSTDAVHRYRIEIGQYTIRLQNSRTARRR
jgi:hypothetical protein